MAAGNFSVGGYPDAPWGDYAGRFLEIFVKMHLTVLGIAMSPGHEMVVHKALAFHRSHFHRTEIDEFLRIFSWTALRSFFKWSCVRIFETNKNGSPFGILTSGNIKILIIVEVL